MLRAADPAQHVRYGDCFTAALLAVDATTPLRSVTPMRPGEQLQSKSTQSAPLCAGRGSTDREEHAGTSWGDNAVAASGRGCRVISNVRRGGVARAQAPAERGTPGLCPLRRCCLWREKGLVIASPRGSRALSGMARWGR